MEKELNKKRLLIIENFDKIRNEVDIDTEELLLRLKRQKIIDHESEVDLTRRRELLIEKLNELQKSCLHSISDKNSTLATNNTKYLRSEYFDGYLNNDKINGLLLLYDFLISNEDFESIRYKFVEFLLFNTRKI